MMTDVYIIGAHSTPFGKHGDKSYSDLTRDTYLGVLTDAGMKDGDAIDIAWFGNCTLHLHNQSTIRGQACFSPLVQEGLFKERTAIVNEDNACATGSLALYGAVNDIKAGNAHVALAIGVEKLYEPDPAKRSFNLFEGGFDQLHPQDWQDYFTRAGQAVDKPFALGANRALTMDTYALQALYHMQRHGSTVAQIALAAAQTHNFGADNELAQYRFRVTADEVLADRPVTHPLTRSMCAPMGDGAAAALVCSGDFLRDCPPSVQERAVKIKGIGLSGGKYRALDEPGLSQVAAQRAYAQAGITAADVDVAEVHDACSFSILYQAEMLGFCPVGQGGRFVENGGAALGGATPMNTSGGLVSKGHPVGATGLSMVFELARQLRGEAGVRQVQNARIAVAENGGGVMGFDEAICAVTVLERN